MNAPSLLVMLAAHGITVMFHKGQMWLMASPGALTPALRQVLKDAGPTLLAHFQGTAAVPCPGCPQRGEHTVTESIARNEKSAAMSGKPAGAGA